MKRQFSTVLDLVDDQFSDQNRIAICGPAFKGRGGIPRVMEQQAETLSTAGYSVTVFTLDAELNPDQNYNLRECGPSIDSGIVNRIYRVIHPCTPSGVRTFRELSSFDIVIVHGHPFSVFGSILNKLENVHYIYWFHPSGPATGFSGIAKLYIMIMHYLDTQSTFIRAADSICAISNPSAEYAKEQLGRQVTLVENQVNPNRFKQQSSPIEIENKYGINPEDRFILYVGRLEEKKNIESLIKIFHEIESDVDNIKLIIIGSAVMPEYVSELKSQASNNVVFTDYVPDKDLATFYDSASVFATCSLEEGWGLPISEAVYFGTKVVAFDSHPAANAESTKLITTVEEGDYSEFSQQLQRSL